MSRFQIRHRDSQRADFGNYEYDILEGSRVIALYWHDFRGDEHGLIYNDGREEAWPVGRMIEFVGGGGSSQLFLTKAAQDHLATALSREQS